LCFFVCYIGCVKFTVVDVQSLRLDEPLLAVRTFALKEASKFACDVVIVGGGMGGVAAALRCLQEGVTVCLTEETDCIGGQATSQGVSALDENRYVETTGAPRSYQRWRESIREHYRLLGLHDLPIYGPRLNPGNCWVSWLAFEPSIGLAELNKLIKPFIESSQLTVLTRHKVVSAESESGLVSSVTAVDIDSGSFIEISGRIFLDATELGDLLPLCGIDYVSGAEARSATNEPHAPEAADPENVQDYTYSFVLEFRPGEIHTIQKPPHYDRFNSEGKFTFNDYRMFECADIGGANKLLPLWHYRRLIDASQFPEGKFERDLSLINWESNDLRDANIIDQSPNTVAQRLALAKSVSLGFLYWLQTEAPRDEGGKGYPELHLRTDVLGTDDGFTKFPYIRESRRIIAKERITETDVAAATNPGARAKLYSDSVGIGLYPIDIHGRQDVPGAAQPARPFQVPLGALLPLQDSNLIAAAKNIGTTHITNGCYRLHPVEWAIGEAAGLLAAMCVNLQKSPTEIREQPQLLTSLQKGLVSGGSPIFWFDDVPTDHPEFADIQMGAVTGALPVAPDHLHYFA
jgi:hypothetical protein